MKKLSFASKGCLTALLCGVSVFSLSVGNKVEATDTIEETKKAFTTMKLFEENVVEEILNGKFSKGKDYFKELSVLDSEEDTSTLSYAYELLGDHYMYGDDVSNAAHAYSVSLNKNPFNFELTQYLQKLGVKDFSIKSIEAGLKNIYKK